MPGAQCTRSLVCAQGSEVCTPVFTAEAPENIRHSPRNGFTGSFALSPVIGLICHRRLRIEGLVRARLGRLTSADLTPASGVRTTRLRRTLQRRSSCALDCSLTSLARPAISSHPTLPRPPHPVLNVRHDREAPLVAECGTARMMLVIWGKAQHRHLAASWRDGQIAHGMHAQSARRAK
jgi:hypothetical protein